jgi:hypothetical protein
VASRWRRGQKRGQPNLTTSYGWLAYTHTDISEAACTAFPLYAYSERQFVWLGYAVSVAAGPTEKPSVCPQGANEAVRCGRSRSHSCKQFSTNHLHCPNCPSYGASRKSLILGRRRGCVLCIRGVLFFRLHCAFLHSIDSLCAHTIENVISHAVILHQLRN